MLPSRKARKALGIITVSLVGGINYVEGVTAMAVVQISVGP